MTSIFILSLHAKKTPNYPDLTLDGGLLFPRIPFFACVPLQMDRRAKDLALRAHALLSTLRTRVQNAFRTCLDLYSPETWLVVYYPLFYFAKVAKRYPQRTDKQGQGILSNWSFSSGDAKASLHVSSSTIEKIALFSVILGPFCYVFLLHYHFLDRRLWKISPAEASSKSEEELERLFQTDVDTGLTEDQVSERQKKYGPNEILTTRNWFYVLLRLAIGTTNLISEVSFADILEKTLDG